MFCILKKEKIYPVYVLFDNSNSFNYSKWRKKVIGIIKKNNMK